MIDELLVSVIMPTYNRAYIIRRAISSVLNQTHSNFELIIVDDGSTDNTAEVVDSFNNSRIVYIKHAINLGIASARNTGIAKSRGEYVAFLDSDDEWLPHKLREQLIAFEEAPSDVGAIYTQIENIEKGKMTYLHPKTPPEGNIYRHVLSGLQIYLPTLMVKRKYVEQAGKFDEDFVLGEDCDFAIRLSRLCGFKFVKTPLVIRYLMPDSISVDNPATPWELERMLYKYFDEIQKDRRVLAYNYFAIGYYMCLRNNLAQGRQYFLKAIRANGFNMKPHLALIASFAGYAFYTKASATYLQIRSLTRRFNGKNRTVSLCNIKRKTLQTIC
jgi:glycosyltransferase involved in cell wall biosynthesis